ncbi:hypothetical protein BH23CHL8_BH23CHL8_10400 [soil metagenome]
MSTNLTPGDGQDLFARLKVSWEARDPDRFVELFSTEAEARVDPFEQPLRGANDLRAHWNAFAAERVHAEFDAERVWVVGRTVLGSFHAASTARATGDTERVRGFMTLELDDAGLITRLRQWSVAQVVGREGSFDAGAPGGRREEGSDG